MAKKQLPNVVKFIGSLILGATLPVVGNLGVAGKFNEDDLGERSKRNLHSVYRSDLQRMSVHQNSSEKNIGQDMRVYTSLRL